MSDRLVRHHLHVETTHVSANLLEQVQVLVPGELIDARGGARLDGLDEACQVDQTIHEVPVKLRQFFLLVEGQVELPDSSQLALETLGFQSVHLCDGRLHLSFGLQEPPHVGRVHLGVDSLFELCFDVMPKIPGIGHLRGDLIPSFHFPFDAFRVSHLVQSLFGFRSVLDEGHKLWVVLQCLAEPPLLLLESCQHVGTLRLDVGPDLGLLIVDILRNHPGGRILVDCLRDSVHGLVAGRLQRRVECLHLFHSGCAIR
mmetsp:Transcript_12620/g.27678  ORF Transcript_12620/g.27678 Transcript_12620/m.27678 type:complete len:257 (-) Transcript_12620:1618-2388(-)